LRIVFMGTPEFAVPTLNALADAGHEIAVVVTQPDRPKGRGRKLTPSPVKVRAEELGLAVYQPVKIRQQEAVEELAKARPEIMVVAAFGQILPKSVLDIPPRGCLNVHASLLPKYRGAAPVNWAIINGEELTGVTIMRMDVGLDTGDMLLKEETRIAADDTTGSLLARLSGIGGRLVVKAIADIEAGRIVPVKQDDSASTYAPMLKKEMGLIDWTKPARETERLVRGLDPWPGAYTTKEGETVRVWGAHVYGHEGYDGAPGEVVDVNRTGIKVMTGDGVLVITEVQAGGGRRMTVSDFLSGHKILKGKRLT